MKPSLLAKLDHLADRLEELNRFLASPEATAHMDQYRNLTREHADIEPVVSSFQAWRQTRADLDTVREMLADRAISADREMRELA